MENKNGQGIFYGVIGVATLVVTIIGATFAFFSASNNSAVNAIATNSTTLSLGYSDEIAGLKKNLIPMNEADPKFKEEPGITATDCVDLNSNEVCSTYQFTITNPSTTTAQRIYVKMKPQTNSFKNLHYAVFKGSASQVAGATNKFNVTGTPVTTVSDATANIIGANGDLVIGDTQLTQNSTTDITLAPLEQVIAPGASVTYTMVLWIHELGTDQTTDDAGKSFAAGINVTTATNSTGVTGVLSTAG